MLRIRSLLDHPDLGLEAVEGTGDLDVAVRWVHVTELPDPEDYVREHELVLTNGLWLSHQTPDGYVRALVKARAIGLVFGLRTVCPKVPHALIAACRAAQLPLLCLPIDVPFAAVTQAVATAQAEQRQRQLLDTLRRNNALTSAVFAGRGLRGLLGVLSGQDRTPVALVDRMGTAVHEVHCTLSESDLSLVAKKLHQGAQECTIGLSHGAEATMIPIQGVGGSDHAVVYGRAADHLGQADRDALEQAVRLLTVELAHQQAVSAIQTRFAGEILDMVLSGPHRAEELGPRLRSFSIDPDGPLGVFIIPSPGAPTPTLAPLPDTVTQYFVGLGLPSVVPSSGQDLVAVVGLRDDHGDLRALAEGLVEALEKTPSLRGQRVLVGTGRVAASHQYLRRSLLQAKEASRVARLRRQGPQVVSFADVGSHRLMVALLDAETRRDFAESVLGPVVEYDRTHNSELRRTLTVFLESGMRWGAAASALHVHVNTLRNRLSKLQRLTSRDLGHTEDLVDLFLALQMSEERD